MLNALTDHIAIESNPFAGKISVKGKVWRLAEANDTRIEALVQGHGLPEIVARVLVQRDLDVGDIEGFLNPTLTNHFPNPFSLKNMDSASEYLADAIMHNRKIGILADFDVDGATSCAVMKRFLNQVGCDNVPVFIPDRLNDGYGPSTKGFDYLKEQGAEIVCVLDCGITSIVPIKHARDIGLEVIVIDHHEPDSELPTATYIINPKLKDDESGFDYLAAVGVTFLFAVGINSKLRQKGHYEVKKEPIMRDFLDLVALGTVCDMVPLIEGNRLFVKQGFPLMAERRNPGLRALLDVSKITTVPDPYHAGFMLGPRINAGSRVHQSHLGSDLLSTSNEAEAVRIAWLLDDCNEKRKGIQKDMTREAMEKAKAMMIEHPDTHGLVIDGEGWHSGLSGLVAGAVKDKYERPVCIIAYSENESGNIGGRASGRSVQGVHIAEILMDAQKQNLIVKGGGHAMAGGFTILKDKLDDFRMFFNKQILESLGQKGHNTPLGEEIDLTLTVQGLSVATVKLLTDNLAPFGMANEEPKTVLSHVKIDHADQVGVNHLRCMVKDAEGGRALKAMAFRALDSDLGKFLRENAETGNKLHLKGQVKINEWQGRESVEFFISDAMLA